MALLAAAGFPALSGPFRAVLGVSPGVALALSGASIAAVLLLWARRAPRRAPADGRTWLALGLAGAGAIATLAMLYNPRFGGLVTVGGGDAGAHAAWALVFIQSDPHQYFGFVSAYAFWHWLGAAFGLDTFERMRAGFYLAALAVPVAAGYGVRLALARGPLLRAPAIWAALALGAASAFGFWPLLHYHQADGFYGHLFALVPLLASWLAYGQLPDVRARAGAVAAAVGVMRFTYGLNLGDLALAGAGVLAWEALGAEPRRLRAALFALSAALAAGALVAYAQLISLAEVEGGFVSTRLRWILPGIGVLAAGLLAAASPAVALPPPSRRLAAFAGAFGAVNLAAQLAYLGAGLQPRYYLYKYGLHAVVLLLVAWVPAGAALASRRRALAACSVAFAAGLVMVSRGSPYQRSFADRLRRAPPWTRVGPLADRDADARITAALAEERAAFGGVLTASWPMASFMNGERGRYLDVPAFRRAELDESPGHCVFWFQRETSPVEAFDPGESREARAATIARLAGDPRTRCDSYAPRWDPAGTQVLCRLCR